VDIVRIEAFELGKGMDEVVSEVIEVASALRDDGGNGVAAGWLGPSGFSF